MDSATLQAMQGIENASVSQDALGNTTIIYEQGQSSCYSRDIFVLLAMSLGTNADVFFQLFSAESSDLSAQNALDLLLNMSNARELVGNTLQVGGVVHQVISFYINNLNNVYV